MAFWKRERAPLDRISSEELATFGRWEFLKEQSGIDPSGIYNMVLPLGELIFSQVPANRALAVAELHRHAEAGEWEKVGAWKFVREFMDEAPDTQPLIDGGLLAIQRMRVTNLSIHLAPIDTPRYEELTGAPTPNDGFFGPPVFDSSYGPTRQYYFDNAISTAAARVPSRVPARPGVSPGDVGEAAKAMWNFGLLIHRGPLTVAPDIAFEPNVVRPAVQAATDVDHDQFAQRVVERIDDTTGYLYGVWSMLGAARFFEEYLDPSVLRTSAYARALDEGLTLLIQGKLANVAMPIEVLTPRAYERLQQVQAAQQ